MVYQFFFSSYFCNIYNFLFPILFLKKSSVSLEFSAISFAFVGLRERVGSVLAGGMGRRWRGFLVDVSLHFLPSSDLWHLSSLLISNNNKSCSADWKLPLFIFFTCFHGLLKCFSGGHSFLFLMYHNFPGFLIIEIRNDELKGLRVERENGYLTKQQNKGQSTKAEIKN